MEVNSLVSRDFPEIIKLLTKDKIRGILSSWDGCTQEVQQSVMTARDALLEKNGFDRSVIPILIWAMEHGSVEVANTLSWIICALTEEYPDTIYIIQELIESKRAHSRARAVMSLSPRLEGSLLTTILEKLLSDRSKKVRQMAADWIGRNQQVRFTHLLQDCLIREQDQELKLLLASELSLLSDGYFIDRSKEEMYVTFIADNGARVGKFIHDQAVARLPDEEIYKILMKEFAAV